MLRTAKLGLDENRETLKMLSEKIQSLETRVVSSASQEPGSVTMGPSRFSVPLVAAGYGQVEETYQSAGITPDPSVGGVSSLIGDHDYGIATAPMLTESMPLHSVSPRTSVISSPMQSPRASRKRSDITPQDNPLAQLIPFVQPGEFVGRATTPSTIHLVCQETVDLSRTQSAFRYVRQHPFGCLMPHQRYLQADHHHISHHLFIPLFPLPRSNVLFSIFPACSREI